MPLLLTVDWSSLFVPSVPVAEIVVRGACVYLFLLVLLRLMRREAGAIGIPDLLLVVLIADAAQNAMASGQSSITDGVILVATIAALDFAVDWLVYVSPVLRRLLRPSPLPLVADGRMLRRNMRHELITPEELLAQLRVQGVDRVADVKHCYLEGDGQMSVIRRDGEGAQHSRREVP
jgi:uncharacterized membrane protein YcaP (DUF421 family)